MTTDLTTVGGLAVALTALIGLLKTILPLSDAQRAWAPLAAIVLGMILAPLIGYSRGEITGGPAFVTWALSGFAAGLQATGVYEAAVRPVKRLMQTPPGTPGTSVHP